MHIGYIGRLDYEKGADIVLDCIRATFNSHNITWHIYWDGDYMSDFFSIGQSKEWVYVYGQVSHESIIEALENLDAILMPSRFLETFWLVALEALSYGVPVIWFAKWWLQEFIPDKLRLDIDDPVWSFFDCIKIEKLPVTDISYFSYQSWHSQFSSLIADSSTILFVHDYLSSIGGAEQYVSDLRAQTMTKDINTISVWYPKKVGKIWRIWLFLLAPFAFWRYFTIKKLLSIHKPDLIWMHSVLRYIWPWWLLAISQYTSKKYITHHDLWLLTIRPKNIQFVTDIPQASSYQAWRKSRKKGDTWWWCLWKWLYIRWLWLFLSKSDIQHIVPSSWMTSIIKKYTHIEPKVFWHTVMPTKNSQHYLQK